MGAVVAPFVFDVSNTVPMNALHPSLKTQLNQTFVIEIVDVWMKRKDERLSSFRHFSFAEWNDNGEIDDVQCCSLAPLPKALNPFDCL